MPDLYENSTWVWDGQVRNIYDDNWYAQTFTPQTTHNITSVILSLGRPSGDTPGTVTVSIKAVDGDNKPVDGDLCSGTTNGNTVPEIAYPTPAPEEREITFGTNPTLTAGTRYAIVVRAPSGSSSNKLYWSASTSSVYANGDQCGSGNSGLNWTLYDTRELWFKEYGNPAVPEKPITPSPSDSGTNITLDHSQLTWEDGGDADTFDVYFGESGSEVLQSSTQAGITWNIPFGTLAYSTTYGWRIDATNVYGTTTGDTWTFDTLAFAPPVPTPTNTLNIIKRLVAAAADKIWYEDI
jgi:hypothetical protein